MLYKNGSIENINNIFKNLFLNKVPNLITSNLKKNIIFTNYIKEYDILPFLTDNRLMCFKNNLKFLEGYNKNHIFEDSKILKFVDHFLSLYIPRLSKKLKIFKNFFRLSRKIYILIKSVKKNLLYFI